MTRIAYDLTKDNQRHNYVSAQTLNRALLNTEPTQEPQEICMVCRDKLIFNASLDCSLSSSSITCWHFKFWWMGLTMGDILRNSMKIWRSLYALWLSICQLLIYYTEASLYNPEILANRNLWILMILSDCLCGDLVVVSSSTCVAYHRYCLTHDYNKTLSQAARANSLKFLADSFKSLAEVSDHDLAFLAYHVRSCWECAESPAGNWGCGGVMWDGVSIAEGESARDVKFLFSPFDPRERHWQERY